MRAKATGCSTRATLLAAGLISLSALAAYSNSFSVPFIFDDDLAIADNPTIRQLWPIGGILWPASAKVSGATGRPLVNLSFAINHALGGLDVRGYHAFNLAVHICSALALFGLVRRTIRRWPLIRGRETLAALAIALIWVVHPLQTESVTYVISRTESLMGLFYLLTLYCFVRYAERESAFAKASADEEAGGGGPWGCFSVLACLLGMFAKEVMVTAPFMVLLYDRTFLAGSFWEAWRRRRRFYVGLGATWIPLVYMVVSEHGTRGTGAGFGLGISWSTYALTQCWAVAHYLRLAFWPHPLLLDYGTKPVAGAQEIIPRGLLLGLLVAGTVWALRGTRAINLRRGFRLRRGFGGRVGGRALGFAGAWFFLVLAPSSSVYPLPTELIAEHRMYLPLAAVFAPVVIGIQAMAGRWGLAACIAISLCLGWMTRQRNFDYRSRQSIWADAVAKRPGNPRARNNLGLALAAAGHPQAAIAQYRSALAIDPGIADIESNLGLALARNGQAHEAIPHYEKAMQLEPDSAEIRTNLGLALNDAGRWADAVACLQRALDLKPDLAAARNGLADAYLGLALERARNGRTKEAAGLAEESLRFNPNLAEAQNDLANFLTQTGRNEEAIGHYEQANRLKPGNAEMHYDLGIALRAVGRKKEALVQYQEALRINPAFSEAEDNVGIVMAELGRIRDAIPHFEAALKLNPNSAAAHENLGLALRALGRTKEAGAQFEAAASLKTRGKNYEPEGPPPGSAR